MLKIRSTNVRINTEFNFSTMKSNTGILIFPNVTAFCVIFI